MVNYVLHGTSRKLYTRRAEFLSKIYTPEKNVLNCSDNAATFIRKLCRNISDFATSMQKGKCQQCDAELENLMTFEIPGEVWQTTFAEGLQMVITQFFEEDLECKKCRTSTGIEKEPGHHLLLDTEYAFTAVIQKRRYSKAANVIALNKVPSSLIIGQKKYVLNGIMSYETGEKVGHYKAFCRNVNGTWMEYNDLSKGRHSVANDTTKRINPSMIVYSKYT